jgi:hypothetical protein
MSPATTVVPARGRLSGDAIASPWVGRTFTVPHEAETVSIDMSYGT